MTQTSTTSSLRNCFPEDALLGDFSDGDIDALFKLLKGLPGLETFNIVDGELSCMTADGTFIHATLPSGMSSLTAHLENQPFTFRSAGRLKGGQLTALIQLDDEYLFTNGQSEVRVPRCGGTPVPVSMPTMPEEPTSSVTLGRVQMKNFAILLKSETVDFMFQEGELLCARQGEQGGHSYTFIPSSWADGHAGKFDKAYRVFDLGLGSGHELTLDLFAVSGELWCRSTWAGVLGVPLTLYEKAHPLQEHHWKK